MHTIKGGEELLTTPTIIQVQDQHLQDRGKILRWCPAWKRLTPMLDITLQAYIHKIQQELVNNLIRIPLAGLGEEVYLQHPKFKDRMRDKRRHTILHMVTGHHHYLQHMREDEKWIGSILSP